MRVFAKNICVCYTTDAWHMYEEVYIPWEKEPFNLTEDRVRERLDFSPVLLRQRDARFYATEGERAVSACQRPNDKKRVGVWSDIPHRPSRTRRAGAVVVFKGNRNTSAGGGSRWIRGRQAAGQGSCAQPGQTRFAGSLSEAQSLGVS